MPSADPTDVSDATLRADALMQHRELPQLERAVELYGSALAHEPENLELQLKLADAMNGVMRVRTHSNAITIDGLLDTPEHKAVWAQMGPRALELAARAHRARPDDARAAAVYADAYMYAGASKGIIEQALAGAANVHRANAERLIRLDPDHESGLGYAMLGCFFTAAPWPYRNLDEGVRQLQAALGVACTQRNAYYVAVAFYRRGEYAKAVEYFRLAQSSEPGSLSERDFSSFIRTECKRALALAEAELAGSITGDDGAGGGTTGNYPLWPCS